MKQFFLFPIAALGLAACQPAAPVSNPGPGFDNYAQYEAQRAARDAQLRGAPIVSTEPVVQVRGPAVGVEPVTSQPLSATRPMAPVAPQTPTAVVTTGSGQQVADVTRSGGIQASPSNAAPTPVNNSIGISREQDFSAVTASRSIESDAQVRAQQQAAYQIVQPTALPTRHGSTGPNIVNYALQTTNVPGQKIYRRARLRSSSVCGQYPSPDAAQRAFLAAGGPQRDRKGFDPDGDGFACGWDPRPFRRAAGR